MRQRREKCEVTLYIPVVVVISAEMGAILGKEEQRESRLRPELHDTSKGALASLFRGR